MTSAISALALCYINLLDITSQKLEKSEHSRFQMIQKVDEFRQTSDVLTHFFRAYATTTSLKNTVFWNKYVTKIIYITKCIN